MALVSSSKKLKQLKYIVTDYDQLNCYFCPCICRPGGRDNAVKLKAMNETVLRLNKANEQLQSENRALKDDLKNSIDGHERSTSSKSDVCLYNS